RIRVDISFSFVLHPRAETEANAAGRSLLTCGSAPGVDLPGAGLQWIDEEARRSQLRGQPRPSSKLSPRSLLRPADAGTDSAGNNCARRPGPKASVAALTKSAGRPFSCGYSTASHVRANRECGAEPARS